MPNTKATEKRLRQSLKRRERNKNTKSSVKTSIRAFENAVKSNDKALAEEKYKSFVKLADTASGKNVMHKNAVARKKSKLHKRLSAM